MEYQIKFGAIELLAKAINPAPTDQVSPDDYHFNFSVGVNASKERRMVIVKTDVDIILTKENFKSASFQTIMVFEIPNFEDVFTQIDETRFGISEELEITLKSVGISTTRGIIYSETRGTYLHSMVLPLIDIPGMVKMERTKKNKVED